VLRDTARQRSRIQRGSYQKLLAWRQSQAYVHRDFGQPIETFGECIGPGHRLIMPDRILKEPHDLESAAATRIRLCWRRTLEIYLIDGTYELFRHYYALPSARDQDGREVAAVRGVLASVLGLLKGGVTHVAVATDQIIESFRNELWPGYKTGEGIEADLLAQFPLLEETLTAAGVVVWPMVEYEADDALASGAAAAAEDKRVDQVIICTPDKDLAQCVSGTRIVQLDRRKRLTRDEAGVIQKFGVPPASIPDYLALVGDAADGYPGLPGWGAKSTAAVLAKFGHIERIPADWREWSVNAASASTLAATLARERDRALLFRTLATLRSDIALFDDVEDLRWSGPTPSLDAIAARFDAAITTPGRGR
jgi:5'-3' exonuclease